MPSRTRIVMANGPVGGTMRPPSTPTAASRVWISSRTSRSLVSREHEREHQRQPELALVHVEPVGALVESAHGIADRTVAPLAERQPRARGCRAMRPDAMH